MDDGRLSVSDQNERNRYPLDWKFIPFSYDTTEVINAWLTTNSDTTSDLKFRNIIHILWIVYHKYIGMTFKMERHQFINYTPFCFSYTTAHVIWVPYHISQVSVWKLGYNKSIFIWHPFGPVYYECLGLISGVIWKLP